MKKTGLIAAFSLLVAAASFGSVGLIDSAKSADAGERAHATIAAMHAAIPASAASGNVFEYASVVTLPAPAQKIMLADGQVFEYY